MLKRIALITGLAIWLTGCVSIGNAIHGYHDLSVPEDKRKDLQIQEARNLSWLIREILPANTSRVKLEKAMGEHVGQVASATHDTALAAGTIAAAATGLPLSSTGGSAFGAAGLGVSVLGSLSGTGNWYYQLGRLYLGDEVNSALDIRLMAREDMLTRFQAGLLEAGLSAECRTNCQGSEVELPWRVYELSGASEPLWALLRLGDMMTAPADPLRDRTLGFRPRRQSAEVGYNSGLSAHGIMIFRDEPKDPDVVRHGKRNSYALDNPKAQKLLRAMSRDGRWVFVWNVGGAQSIVAWSGRLYKHDSTPPSFGDASNIIDYEILE